MSITIGTSRDGGCRLELEVDDRAILLSISESGRIYVATSEDPARTAVGHDKDVGELLRWLAYGVIPIPRHDEGPEVAPPEPFDPGALSKDGER